MADAESACSATYRDVVIDFSNGSVFKLNPASPQELGPEVAPLLVPGEQVVACFKAVRDFVVFTDKRLIAVNVQGMTGRKKDFTSLPYSKVQAFSIETAGTFDLDAELDLWFSGLGKVRLEFKGSADIRGLGQMIAGFVL
ncbi:PH domain-containing protein [Geodermatophilus siccatus]|uniref:PH domain-containing protein n=1 Tax=Geodermatophilus siccatus TaxID=1137991 RepID=A0A1G9VHH1_9ACTN|nr:PH domain-containing protein [Geodermatophilus siccatus]